MCLFPAALRWTVGKYNATACRYSHGVGRSFSTFDVRCSTFNFYLVLNHFHFHPFSSRDFISYHTTEPTEDWTVEQVLKWWVLRAHSECEAEYSRIVDDLSAQLKEGTESLWQAHEEVSSILDHGVDKAAATAAAKAGGTSTDGLENSDPQHLNVNSSNNIPSCDIQKPAAARGQQQEIQHQHQHQIGNSGETETKDEDAGATGSSSKIDTIRIVIISGFYEGMSLDVQPKGRTAAFVGRSQGKKFKEKGVSLPKDLEVSTSHGKFESIRGKFYYTDVGSTNGSLINGCAIEPSKPYEVREGMEISCGQTIMSIKLVASGRD